MNGFGEEEFTYSFMIDSAGVCSLLQGTEVMWTSDGDMQFINVFPETVIDESDLPEVQKYLEQYGYLPPGVTVTFDPDAQEEQWGLPDDNPEELYDEGKDND